MSRLHDGLDLSRFKKVSSDKKTTILRHKNGHELRIASSALTPKMRESLETLPEHEDAQRYKKGGMVKKDEKPEDSQPLDPESPADANSVGYEPSTTDAETPPAQEPSPLAAQPAPPAPTQQDAPVQDTPVQQAPQAPAYQPIASDPLKAENDAWAQDLKNGHVTPKTYQDLFNDKGTLGKIGTLFGLLVSGAGSGLSHQPNAVMEMMNKEISNDLEAQKASKTNAVNYTNMNLTHQMNNAQIENLKKTGVLTEAQAKSMETDAKTKAYTLARMQMNSSALHKLVLQANKYPVGSKERQAADQQLALLSQATQSENYNLADKAAAASALGSLAFGQDQGGDDPEGNFQKQQTALRMSGNAPLADDKVSRHFPGVEGSASIPLTPADRDQINSGVTFQDQMKRFMEWTKNHSGDLSPSERNEGEAMAAQLQGAFRLATKGGVYKEGEQGFISNIIDSTPTKFFNSIRVMPKLTAVQRESAAQLDQMLKSKGFKGYAGNKEAPKTKSQPKDGATGTYNGKAVVFSGGKWKFK